MKIKVNFTRVVTVEETCEAVLEVDHPVVKQDVLNKIEANEMERFLVRSRKYGDPVVTLDKTKKAE